MPASKCPACGYRNGQSAQTCANCGRGLGIPAPPAPVVPLPEPRRRVRQPIQAAQTPGKQSVSSMIVAQGEEERSPYQITMQDKTAELIPFESLAPLPIVNAQPSSVAEPSTRLPFGFALSRPALVGKIIHLETREQVNDFPNFAGAILAIIAEIVWVIPNVQATREPVDKIEVTRLRVEHEQGQTHDALIRGSLRGANLSLGDTVSLWGHRRKGNLVVSRGYNHTTRSTISTTAIGSLLPALLLLLVVAALYLSFSHMSPGEAFNHLKELPAWFKDQTLPFLH